MKGQIHPVYDEMPRTIFDFMTGLAREVDAINLGQGFPDEQGPAEVIEAAVLALREKSNQYPPGAGLPELRRAICEFYRRGQGLSLTPEQVIVTSGGTEAIAAAILALVRLGDEVILFQPAYDAYAPMVKRAGGVPVSVKLAAPDWRYRAADVEAALTPLTRLLMLNDPLNPMGTVASEDELASIARLCVKHDLLAICDEVWEHVRFDGKRHRSLLTCPGMEDRAVKIGSAGKIFGLTGWKVGWLCAAPGMAEGLGKAHQFLTYTTPPALQWAVAEGLGKPDGWFAGQIGRWAASRARLKSGLQSAGFDVLPNDATWFLCVDLAASGIPLDDRTFSERAVREASVASIPVSALFGVDGRPKQFVRFCYTKPDSVLDEAVARLGAFRSELLSG